ncbi:MAG: type IV secretion protein IcmB [Pseudomonadota bacterium]|nr:type IV secretion protein IcmB [Pseudomonadota bacterium]
MLENLFAPFFTAFRQSLDSNVQLETADGPTTLAASDGSLVTLIRVDGSRQIIGNTEYNTIIDQATVKLATRFGSAGHGFQVWYTRDPGRVHQELETLVRPVRQTGKSLGLDLQDLVDERVRNLEHYVAHEEMYFVLWTRASALTRSDQDAAKKQRGQTKWVPSRESQFPWAGIEQLRARHSSFVASVSNAMEEMGIQAKVMEVHAALRAIRNSIYPSLAHDRWQACLPGDPLIPRAPRSRRDMSDVLWPSLRQQICVGDAEVLSQSTARIGDQIWTGIDMTLGPMDPTPFSVLMQRVAEANVPFRVSFLLESGGIEGAQIKKFLASILGVTNSANKQIKDSIESLTYIARDQPVVRLRVSFATWAHHSDPKKLEAQASTIIQAVECWGYCQVSQLSGDPIECIMSSALGIACASTAPAAVVPLKEVIRLLPWHRSSSPFEQGSFLLRTGDGHLWPYQTGSTLTTTWFDLIFAQPGAGKSVLMNALNLATCLTPGLSRLPYVAMIDIGPSSSGLISLIRDALPPERRHEAMHFRLQMTPEYSVNPFDTQLGCRVPLPDERAYLVELLTLLCTPAGQTVPYDGIPQLCGLVVDEMFRWRTDGIANAEPRGYLSRVDEDVDKALKDHDIQLPEEPVWWDVVDALFDKGLVHEAALAQRHAAPTLADAVTAARRPQIRGLLEETHLAATTEGVISAFERMIASAIREFPILSGVTRFDIGNARICAVDLGEVAPQGDENADRQTAIMYMLARHTLIRHWWLGDQIVKLVPERYREHHAARVRDTRESPKRLCYDEFHRTSRSRAVRAQVIRDVREGRKWGVQIVLASQLLEDFDNSMVDMATGVWILGSAVSEKSLNATADCFGLSDTARWYMKHRLTGPRSYGAPLVLVLGTNEGRYEQFLINTLGPVELWALSSSAEDMIIRSQLYDRIGPNKARQILAGVFPGGSARNELSRRTQLRLERGEIEAGARSAVIQEIVEELVDRLYRNEKKV